MLGGSSQRWFAIGFAVGLTVASLCVWLVVKISYGELEHEKRILEAERDAARKLRDTLRSTCSCGPTPYYDRNEPNPDSLPRKPSQGAK